MYWGRRLLFACLATLLVACSASTQPGARAELAGATDASSGADVAVEVDADIARGSDAGGPEYAAFADAYDAYGWLVGKLRAGEADAEFDARFEAAAALLFVDRDEREAVLAQVADRDAVLDLTAVYEPLMRARPNADLLYAWVAKELHRDDTGAGSRRGSGFAWRDSYALEAALLGYEATGQERFLVSARDRMLGMLDHRDDVLGRVDEHRERVLKAWGTDHLDPDGRHYNVVTHAGRIAAPMAWYAWLVAQDPELGDEHADAAARLVAAAQEALLEFDDELVVADDGSYAYYWRSTHDRIDPVNHQTSVGEALVYLAALSDDPYWELRATQTAAFVRQVMYYEDDGTVAWQYAARPEDPLGSRPEPIWKSQITIRFLRHAERLGVGFDAEDLAAVAESFRVNVLRDGSERNAMFAAELVALDRREDHRYGGPNNLTPHLLLGAYHDDLHEQLFDIIVSEPAVGGWFAHGKTAAAYAYVLDRAGPADVVAAG
ncbi:hypothetical protein [Egicoccus sp. AB-alg2]|uniref:hypothetical protein n=1 Tax=Egicoccus sp. AB-alg2 TaxID=3242693 RepID=UPI00359E90FB